MVSLASRYCDGRGRRSGGSDQQTVRGDGYAISRIPEVDTCRFFRSTRIASVITNDDAFRVRPSGRPLSQHQSRAEHY